MRTKKLLTSRQIFRYAVPARTVTKKALDKINIISRKIVRYFVNWAPGQENSGPLARHENTENGEYGKLFVHSRFKTFPFHKFFPPCTPSRQPGLTGFADS